MSNVPARFGFAADRRAKLITAFFQDRVLWVCLQSTLVNHQLAELGIEFAVQRRTGAQKMPCLGPAKLLSPILVSQATFSRSARAVQR